MCWILYNKFSFMIGEILIGRLTNNKPSDKTKKINVKQSCKRSGVAQMVPGGLGPQIS